MGAITSYQPQSTESTCGGGALQGGGFPYGEGPSREQRLDDKDRYEGCPLFSANTSNSSEASPVPMDGDHLPVLLPAVWTVVCPIQIPN